MRAAFQRLRMAPSDRMTAVPHTAIHKFAPAQPTTPCEPDLILLAALTLGGLMDPATAMIIAILEADRLRDQRRVR